MLNCVFCEIAAGAVDAAILWETSELVAFLDIAPIREGHTHIIPRQHYETFEMLPAELASKILVAGQELARRLKRVYGVQRVAFLFTGGDVPHVHAHVIPMHTKTDVTSARYLTGGAAQWASDHLMVSLDELRSVRSKLGYAESPDGDAI